MLNRKLIVFIALFGSFFESIGENLKKQTLTEAIGKPVFVFVEISDLRKSLQFSYTTELSRILLVGEPQMLEDIRCLPFINNVINPVLNLVAPVFDNRFENFINSIEKFSQRQLQKAIEDAILLSPYNYNTNAYSATKLLNLLSSALQNKIVYTKNQIKHDYKWDPKALNSLKKSAAYGLGLITLLAVTSKYIDKTTIDKTVSNIDGLNRVATLGLIPVSYKILKNCYKIMRIRPNACNHNLAKYEELLVFVQKLKAQLETNKFITIELANGGTATLKDNQLFFN